MSLPSDAGGFLRGEPIPMGRETDRLRDIRADIRAIRGLVQQQTRATLAPEVATPNLDANRAPPARRERAPTPAEPTPTPATPATPAAREFSAEGLRGQQKTARRTNFLLERILEALEERGNPGDPGGNPSGGLGWILVLLGAWIAKLLVGATSLLKKGPLAALFAGLGLFSGWRAADADPNLTERERNDAKGAAVGGFAGAIGGTIAGAKGGALLGAFLGPLGAAVGGVVGALAGGVAGAWGGKKLGYAATDGTQALAASDAWNRIAQRWSALTQTLGARWDAFLQQGAALWRGWRTDASGLFARMGTAWEAIAQQAGSLFSKVAAKLGALIAPLPSRAARAANTANQWVQDKTGVDVKRRVGGAVAATREAVGGAVTATKAALSNAIPMRNETKRAFSRSIYDKAIAQGSSPDEALLISAQASLESGYGKHTGGEGNHNLFGIKSHHKRGGRTLTTQEVKNGQVVTEKASFREYASVDESIADRARFLKENPRYDKAGYAAAQTAEEKAAALGRAGYATDPKYVEKLNRIIGRIRADVAAAPTAVTAVQNPSQSASGYQNVAEYAQQTGLGAIGDGFGPRQAPKTTTGVGSSNHRGIDIKPQVRGATPDIKPLEGGSVLSVGAAGKAGNQVVVKHADGTTSSYSHLSRSDVKVGDVVTRESVLGRMGTTGNSSGSHLHLATKNAQGEFVDPQKWMQRATAPTAPTASAAPVASTAPTASAAPSQLASGVISLMGMPSGVMSAFAAPLQALSVQPSMPFMPSMPSMPRISGAPEVADPVTSGGASNRGKSKDQPHGPQSVSQDVRDRRIAHIVTGGIGAAL